MDQAKKEIIITYETLFELLKRERDRPDLQKLEPNFLVEVLAYLREKRNLADQSQHSYEDSLKAQRELENTRKIVRELYDRREKKIVSMSLDQSRTKSKLFDDTALLKEERDLFEKLKMILDSFREGVLQNLMKEKMPSVYTYLEQKSAQQAPPVQSSPQQTPQPQGGQHQAPTQSESAPAEASQPQPAQQDVDSDTKTVRFLHAVPKFVGPELEEYGPFAEDDIASLPNDIVDVLLAKERVEQIHGG